MSNLSKSDDLVFSETRLDKLPSAVVLGLPIDRKRFRFHDYDQPNPAQDTFSGIQLGTGGKGVVSTSAYTPPRIIDSSTSKSPSSISFRANCRIRHAVVQALYRGVTCIVVEKLGHKTRVLNGLLWPVLFELGIEGVIIHPMLP